jgi:hypothetical protein
MPVLERSIKNRKKLEQSTGMIDGPSAIDINKPRDVLHDPNIEIKKE